MFSALYISVLLMFFVYILAAAVGLVIYAYYQQKGCDPIRAVKITTPNQVIVVKLKAACINSVLTYTRPEGPKPTIQLAESEKWEFCGKSCDPLSTQLEGLGRCKLPQRDPKEVSFGAFWLQIISPFLTIRYYLFLAAVLHDSVVVGLKSQQESQVETGVDQPQPPLTLTTA